MGACMNFFEAIGSGFRNYVNFSGRAPRSEYWYWTLFAILLVLAAFLIDVSIGREQGILTVIAELIIALPGLAVSVRRLHDLDKSGWFVLLAFVPLVGSIILLIWFCMRGTAGSNRFGPDPLKPET
jgi:uncharacterized membrane protein YhaH (DUF805 family)